MDIINVTTFLASVLIVAFQIFDICDAERQNLEISPEYPSIVLGERESIHVRCTCTTALCLLRWKRYMSNNTDEDFTDISAYLTERVYQWQSRFDTKTLVIRRSRIADSGKYVCVSEGNMNNLNNNTHRMLLINVTTINSKLNCNRMFHCNKKRKISCANVCDGRKDCADGLDEMNCKNKPQLRCKVFECNEQQEISCNRVCDGQQDCANGHDEQNCTSDSVMNSCYEKFGCKNGLCIAKKHVCDLNANFRCSDSSDEENCEEIKDNLDLFQTDPKMVWLKTGVYITIGCTISVVLITAIIVVAIFRIKMKRAALRRAMHHSERRERHDRHGNRHDRHGYHCTRSLRNSVVEHEPFISAPSPTYFGNIIVNVNNGVQYIPHTDLNSVLQGPPSYSEVLAMESVGRHSPPPDYSTIDRNARNDVQTPTLVENLENLEMERMGGQSIQSFSAHDIQGSALGAASRPECTHSLGRPNRSQAGSRDRHVRNVRAHPLPQRPKQLQVRNGQILLDDNSSGSSSPETVSRNTQTNSTNLRPISTNLSKPGQLQMDRGQIILSNQSDRADTDEHDNAGACSVQGQLEVKEGQIMFKAT